MLYEDRTFPIDPEKLFYVLELVVTAAFIIYGAVRGSVEINEKVSDWIDRHWRHTSFRVKKTTFKTIIGEGRTEFIKLRLIKPYERLQTFSMDYKPTVVETSSVREKPVKVSNHYSVPGRAEVGEQKYFEIHLMPDEVLKPYRYHPVLLGYTMEESLEYIFREPGVIATQPVGEESLVVEVHFPPNRYYKRDNSDDPVIEVYTFKPKDNTISGEKEKVFLLSPERVNVIGGRHNYFGADRDKTDWFRVTVKKPPQDGDIFVDWFWQEEIVGNREKKERAFQTEVSGTHFG